MKHLLFIALAIFHIYGNAKNIETNIDLTKPYKTRDFLNILENNNKVSVLIRGYPLMISDLKRKNINSKEILYFSSSDYYQAKILIHKWNHAEIDFISNKLNLSIWIGLSYSKTKFPEVKSGTNIVFANNYNRAILKNSFVYNKTRYEPDFEYNYININSDNIILLDDDSYQLPFKDKNILNNIKSFRFGSNKNWISGKVIENNGKCGYVEYNDYLNFYIFKNDTLWSMRYSISLSKENFIIIKKNITLSDLMTTLTEKNYDLNNLSNLTWKPTKTNFHIGEISFCYNFYKNYSKKIHINDLTHSTNDGWINIDSNITDFEKVANFSFIQKNQEILSFDNDGKKGLVSINNSFPFIDFYGYNGKTLNHLRVKLSSLEIGSKIEAIYSSCIKISGKSTASDYVFYLDDLNSNWAKSKLKMGSITLKNTQNSSKKKIKKINVIIFDISAGKISCTNSFLEFLKTFESIDPLGQINIENIYLSGQNINIKLNDFNLHKKIITEFNSLYNNSEKKEKNDTLNLYAFLFGESAPNKEKGGVLRFNDSQKNHLICWANAKASGELSKQLSFLLGARKHDLSFGNKKTGDLMSNFSKYLILKHKSIYNLKTMRTNLSLIGGDNTTY